MTPRRSGIRGPTAAYVGSERILVADGDAYDRAVTRSILRQYGYSVLEAASGEDALLLGESEARLHLLITAWVHPTMSGSTLAARLIARHPDLRVLYTSSYRFVGTPDAPGAHEPTLYKPYGVRTLLRTVRTLLDEPSMRVELTR